MNEIAWEFLSCYIEFWAPKKDAGANHQLLREILLLFKLQVTSMGEGYLQLWV